MTKGLSTKYKETKDGSVNSGTSFFILQENNEIWQKVSKMLAYINKKLYLCSEFETNR